MVTPPPSKGSRFILHSPTWLMCFSFPEPLLFCTYSRPSEPGFRSASMEPSILVIYDCTAMHPILSTTGQHLSCLRFYGPEIWADTARHRQFSFHNDWGLSWGFLKVGKEQMNCTQWMGTDAQMARHGSYVCGLGSGCWLCSLFFSMLYLLKLECLRWLPHFSCPHYGGWSAKASQTSLYVAFPCGYLDSVRTGRSQGTQISFLVASFPSE